MGFMITPNADSMRRFHERAEAARNIDPDAFRGFKITHFSDEQLARQAAALAKADAMEAGKAKA